MSLIAQIAVFLGATVLAIPLFRRLRLSSILGYLAAGVVIGPWGLRIVQDTEGVMHTAEFGVVLLLFVIGLELQPSRLWVLRKSVFGLGGVQVLATALVLGLAALALGLTWQSAVVIGFALAMSSTAFVLQVLAERKELTTRHGRSAFAILLFQDLAVIPLLALIPLLAITIGLYLTARRRVGASRRRISLVLRTVLLTALVLALAGFRIVLPVDRLATVFVVDMSDSVGNAGREDALAFLRDSLTEMPEGDVAGIVAFGKQALVERLPSDVAELSRLASTPVTTATDIGVPATGTNGTTSSAPRRGCAPR